MHPMFHNIGAYIKAVYASAIATLTAGSTGDNTQVTGSIVDREAVNMPLSAVVAVAWKAVLAEHETLKLAYVIQDGNDSALGDAATFASGTAAVVGTGLSGGSTLTGVLQIPVDLGGAKRYVRALFTPDLSASGTDTGECSSMWIFGGAPELPTT